MPDLLMPDPEDLTAYYKRKQRAYLAKRRKWLIECEWPWPEEPQERPPPATLDTVDEELG
jgi:hypothetical protein